MCGRVFRRQTHCFFQFALGIPGAVGSQVGRAQLQMTQGVAGSQGNRLFQQRYCLLNPFFLQEKVSQIQKRLLAGGRVFALPGDRVAVGARGLFRVSVRFEDQP